MDHHCNFQRILATFISSPTIPDFLPSAGARLLDCYWHIEKVDIECVFLHCGGVVHGGVDTLLLGFDPTVLLRVSWAFMSLSSWKGHFVPCGFSSRYRTSTSPGPSLFLCLFSQNLAPPLIQALVSSVTFTFSTKLKPIYPLLMHFPFFCRSAYIPRTPKFHYLWSIFRYPFHRLVS